MKEPNISIYLFFAHHSILFDFQCSVYWWKGVSDFSVLKYYQLNINYLVNILSECLRILINCSQLSKTYYNMLFGSSTQIVMHDAYIGGRSENNSKCVVVHNDLRQMNQTTQYNCRFSATSLALPYSVLSQNPTFHFRLKIQPRLVTINFF